MTSVQRFIPIVVECNVFQLLWLDWHARQYLAALHQLLRDRDIERDPSAIVGGERERLMMHRGSHQSAFRVSLDPCADYFALIRRHLFWHCRYSCF
jgi:hypothetical protein